MSELNNQEKLEEVFHMTKENNEILRGMRRQQHIANVFRLFYWAVILIALGGTYYYVRPLINLVSGNKGKIDDTVKQFEDIRSHLPTSNPFVKFLTGSGNATSTNDTSAQ